MCKSKEKRIEQKDTQDINQHKNQHINQAIDEQNKCKKVIINQKIYQQINQHLNQHLKVIEKYLFKKIQKHEKQKTLIESQINSIRNMVSKVLSNNEISEDEFKKILFETEKYRKKVETYGSFDEANFEFDKMLPKKSETIV